jgi:hypothetical protein
MVYAATAATAANNIAAVITNDSCLSIGKHKTTKYK